MDHSPFLSFLQVSKLCPIIPHPLCLCDLFFEKGLEETLRCRETDCDGNVLCLLHVLTGGKFHDHSGSKWIREQGISRISPKCLRL